MHKPMTRKQAEALALEVATPKEKIHTKVARQVTNGVERFVVHITQEQRFKDGKELPRHEAQTLS